jgi:hypothetical protein
LARDRAHAVFSAHDFLPPYVRRALERLGDVTHLLVIGCGHWCTIRLGETGLGGDMRRSSGTQCSSGRRHQAEEDALPLPRTASSGASRGTLDTVNDLPGALMLIRRALKPDGLFLGMHRRRVARLRQALFIAGSGTPAHHPIDVRAAGVCSRAPTSLPVADKDVAVRYSAILTLMQDLRGMGGGNI